MQNQASGVPLEIQLQAVCQPRLQGSYEVLVPYLPALKEWNPREGSSELFIERAKKHLNLTALELIEYLKEHPETCSALLIESYDKRYSPTTFIEEWKNNQYRVGWVTSAGNPLINQIRVFSSFAEAAADYVLFSWDFPRLTKEQANWYEIDHY
jgi:hypothetical protein